MAKPGRKPLDKRAWPKNGFKDGFRAINGKALPESPFLRYGEKPGEFTVRLHVLDGSRRPRAVLIACELSRFPRLTCPEEIVFRSAKFTNGGNVPAKFFFAMRHEAAKAFLGAIPGRVFLP